MKTGGALLAFFIGALFCLALFAEEKAPNPAESEKQLLDHINAGGFAYSKGDYDRSIEEYTKAIELKPDSALLYSSRALPLNAKGDFDLAIRDCNKALELMPNCADAYNSRGLAYFGKGDIDQAIMDFEKATEVDMAMQGEHVFALLSSINRGDAHYARGEFLLAVSDYKKALTVWPGGHASLQDARFVGPYLGMAQERLGEDGKPAFAEWRKSLKAGDWKIEVAKMFLGEITPDACIAAAADKDTKRDKSNKCSAYFYVGEYYLLHSDKDHAVKSLQSCVEMSSPGSVQCWIAKAELIRLLPPQQEKQGVPVQPKPPTTP